MCWIFCLIVSPKTPMPDEVKAMSPNRNSEFTQGLTCPWGHSMAIIGSQSKYIHLSVFCSTALTVTSSRYLLSRLIKIWENLFPMWVLFH